SATLAAEQPVTLFLSGPAGGVIGARFAAERSGVRDFVSLDMGGTSNDVAMVRGGEALIAAEGAIGPYPVRTPMVDVSTIGAAGGIHRVINARMADQIRLVTIKRGYDPRQFSLVVLGGAGPVHGVALAEEMGMAEVIVPEAPGVLAAFGLLSAAIEHHHARTLHCRADDVDLAAVNRCLAELDEAGRAWMREEGVPLSGVEVSCAAD